MSMDAIIKHTSSRDTVYIINFWATWCAPCVEELPVFNKLKAHYKDKPVRVILVSLDFKENYPMKLGYFLDRKKIMPDVIWLTDTNPNEFIPKIDNRWEGSIPATIVVRPGTNKLFHEGQVTERQVIKMADKLLQ